MFGRGLMQVFSKGWYVLLAATTALAIFVLTTWLGNLGLVWQVATSPWLPLTDKAKILMALTGSIGTNFTIFSASCAIAIAALFGLNVAVAVYVFREQRVMTAQSGQTVTAASFGGLVSGLFGIGCAACGTFLLSPALTFFGIGTLITLLPFGGEEFGALGVGMLGLSLILSARKIGQPVTCQISIETQAPNGRSKDRLPSDLATNPTRF